MSINLSTGPSSWDRDMQGMPDMDEEESENLAALGMHITDDDKKEEDEDEDEEEEGVVTDEVEASADDDEDEDDEIDVEEVDELEELDHLAKKLKEEESPTLIDDMDE